MAEQTERDNQQQALEPVEQEIVPFHNHEIIAVRLADDRICIVLRWVCATLHLDPQAQVRRIGRTEAITGELVRVKVQTQGGKQIMPALTLRGFPTWILGINSKEVKGDTEAAKYTRQMIIAYQVEAVDVLYNHFATKSRSILPKPQATIVQPMEEPGADAGHAEKSTYHETMAIWHRWQADYHMQQWRKEVQEHQGTIENRLEEQQTMSDLLPGIIERLGPPTITLEQQTLVQYYVSQLSKATNKPPATIYASLKAAFKVPRYQELPASMWERVVQ